MGQVKNKIPFSPPRMDHKIEEAVLEVLRSGWITTGPKTAEFEQALTKYIGNAATLCVNSATAGLELMLRWFGVQEGDEVIVPAYTYCSTANVVVHCGATPVMVDIDASDFNLSLNAVEAAITERTKAIIPVDIAGYPCEYELLLKLLSSEKIKALFRANHPLQEKLGRVLILSDAAHSIGASNAGIYTGAMADCSVFSFHAVKNITTAEGGAIALNLPPQFDVQAVYSELRTWSLHGQSKDAMAKLKAGGWRYDVKMPGYKCNMTDIQAAMGLAALSRYPEDLKRRKEIFDAYSSAFKEKTWAELPPYHSGEKKSSCHAFLLRIRGISETQRDQMIVKINERGVAVNVHFIPLPLLSFYQSKGYSISDYPNAYDSYKREISLPVFYDLGASAIEQVIQAVVASVEETLTIS